MQDEPAQRPFRRTRIHHPRRRPGKMRRLSRPEKRRHLCRRRRRAIGRPDPSRRGHRRNPAPPRQGRLSQTTRPRIGQRIASQLIHQDERIKHHILAQTAHPGHCLDHRHIGRRTAINRTIRNPRHQLRRRSTTPSHTPWHRRRIRRILFHFRAHAALASAQIIAKPRHHQ